MTSAVTTVDHTSAYFALAGALGAALLAIVGNQFGLWRQRKADLARLDRQLTAERERLNDTLRAESDRQTERLDHERRLRDLATAREYLAPVLKDVTDSFGLMA